MNTGSIPTTWRVLNDVSQLSVTPSQRRLLKSAEIIATVGTKYKQMQFPTCLYNFLRLHSLPILLPSKFFLFFFSVIKAIIFWFVSSIHLLKDDCNSPTALNWSCSFIQKTVAVWAELQPTSQITKIHCPRQALRLNSSHLILGINAVSLA